MDEETKTVLLGAASTALIGLAVFFYRFLIDKIDSKNIYNWLKENSSKDAGNTFRTTRSIASHCNLAEERVRQLCITNKKIFLSTGTKEDLWSIHSRKPKGFFDL